MNKGYAAGNVEKMARDILASMQVVCPDKVWQDLSLELEQTRGATDSGLKNKLSTPQTLILVLLILSGSTFFVWKYMAGKGNPPITYKTPAPSQIIKSTPLPVKTVPAAVVKDSVAIKTDSVHPVQNIPVALAAVPIVQNTNKKQTLSQHSQKLNPAEKKDSVATSAIGQNTSPPPHKADTAGIFNVIQSITHDSVN